MLTLGRGDGTRHRHRLAFDCDELHTCSLLRAERALALGGSAHPSLTERTSSPASTGPGSGARLSADLAGFGTLAPTGADTASHGARQPSRHAFEQRVVRVRQLQEKDGSAVLPADKRTL
jgi:hypothetical protein